MCLRAGVLVSDFLFQNPDQPLASYMTRVNVSHCPITQFYQLENKNINCTYFIELF